MPPILFKINRQNNGRITIRPYDTIPNQNRDASPVFGFRIQVLAYIGFRRGVTGVSPVPKIIF